jgi:nucleotide-binding universal stress UspA family protein
MYQHILVPLDGSELAEQAIPHARKLAQPPAHISLLRAMPQEYIAAVEQAGRYASKFSTEETLAKAEAEERAYLERMAQQLQQEGYQITTRVTRHSAAEAIVEYANHHDVELIVIASHGRSGIQRWILGSVTQKVLHSAHIPVLVIRPNEKH